MYSVGEGASFDFSMLKGAERLAAEDAARSEYLARRAKEEGIPNLPCWVCGQPIHEKTTGKTCQRCRNREAIRKGKERGLIAPNPCMVCGGEIKIAIRLRDRKLCEACSKAGWRGQQCECGAPLHHRDICGAAKWLRGKCGKCRAELRTKEGGPNTKREAA